MTDYGFDTASTVNGSLAASATSQFGNGFWVRYFSPSPAANVINSSSANANSEISAMFAYGAHHLAPVSEPTQSRLSTTGSTGSSYGYADAVTFVNALINVYTWVAPLQLPAALYCYLGLESGTALSGAYWGAWAGYINGYNYAGGQPFFAALYCNPSSNQPNCSTIAAAAAGRNCFGIWSSEPEPCARCTERFGTDNSWSAAYCTNFHTILWQYAEKGGCAASCGKTINANIDLDAGHSEYGDLGLMFSFNSG
jgi:hypothetical protein